MVAVVTESSDVPEPLDVWDWSVFYGVSSPINDKKETAMFACVRGELVLEIVIVPFNAVVTRVEKMSVRTPLELLISASGE